MSESTRDIQRFIPATVKLGNPPPFDCCAVMQGTRHSSLLRNTQTTPWKFNGTIKVSFQKQLFQDTNGIKCSTPIDSQSKLGIWLPFMPLKNSLLIFTIYNLPSETALSLKINRLWSSWEFERLYILKNSPRNAVYLVMEKSCSLFCPELFMQLHAQIREPKHSPLQLINGSKVRGKISQSCGAEL